jgi:hypothetical protein
MSRPLGGYIGHRPVPAAAGVNSAAGGMWTLREAQRLKQGGTWPSTPSLDVTGISAWWDFSDATQTTLVGSALSQILDKSGTGRTAAQANASNRPTITTNAMNGLSVANFNGSTHHLTYDTDLFTFTGAATVFVVCRNIVNADGRYGAFVSEYREPQKTVWLGPGLYDLSQRGFRPGYDTWAGQTIETTSSFGSPTQTSPAVIQYYWENWSTHHNNGTTLIGVNNDSTPTTALGGSPPSSFSGSAALRQIGAANYNGDIYAVIQGDVGEIMVFTSALNAGRRLAVRQYLGAKWGITVA